MNFNKPDVTPDKAGKEIPPAGKEAEKVFVGGEEIKPGHPAYDTIIAAAKASA
jgi:hypothetical protein